MPLYETMIIFRGSATVAQVVTEMKLIARKAVESGGVIRTIDNLGVRTLPHPMKRFRVAEEFGRYVRWRHDCSPDQLQEVHYAMKTSYDVLRHATMSIAEDKVLKEYLYYYPKSPFRTPGPGKKLKNPDPLPEHLLEKAVLRVKDAWETSTEKKEKRFTKNEEDKLRAFEERKQLWKDYDPENDFVPYDDQK